MDDRLEALEQAEWLVSSAIRLIYGYCGEHVASATIAQMAEDMARAETVRRATEESKLVRARH